jgi:hypothetical protein
VVGGARPPSDCITELYSAAHGRQKQFCRKLRKTVLPCNGFTHQRNLAMQSAKAGRANCAGVDCSRSMRPIDSRISCRTQDFEADAESRTKCGHRRKWDAASNGSVRGWSAGGWSRLPPSAIQHLGCFAASSARPLCGVSTTATAGGSLLRCEFVAQVHGAK